MKKKRMWLILLLLVVVAGGSGYAYYARTARAAQAEEEPAVQTTVARRGDITVSATGAGTVIAAEEIELGFGSNGRLTEVLVQVGDRVGAGQVIADGPPEKLEADETVRRVYLGQDFRR